MSFYKKKTLFGYMNSSKILVISKGNFPKGITHKQYHELDNETINIAEYDIVIINLVDLNQYDIENLYLSKSAITMSKIHDLLWSNKHLILIYDNKDIKLDNVFIQPFKFLPFSIPLKKEIGDTILITDKKYEEYYKTHVNKWSSYLRDDGVFTEKTGLNLFKRKEFEEIYQTMWLSESIAQNGFKQDISFSIRYGYIEKHNRKKVLSGLTTFLQAPNKTNSELAIKTLLSGFGISITTNPPKWTDLYKVPDEDKIIKEIDELETSKEKISKKIDYTVSKLRDETRFKKLLFESGDELRNIVWDTLEAIGFKVNKYDEAKEDGSIEYDKEVILLETKARDNGNTQRANIRQIDDWIGEYLSKKNFEPKGLFIINHDRLKKPNERMIPFPDDVIKYLDKNSRKIIVMTTKQLFDIYCDVKLDKKNKAANIRKKIIETEGIFEYE